MVWCFGGGDVVHGGVILRGWKMRHVSIFNFLFFQHGITRVACSGFRIWCAARLVTHASPAGPAFGLIGIRTIRCCI
jgi:hypothetical protein